MNQLEWKTSGVASLERACEMRDGLLQNIVAASMLARKAQVAIQDGESTALLRVINATLDESAEQIRSVIRQLEVAA